MYIIKTQSCVLLYIYLCMPNHQPALNKISGSTIYKMTATLYV